MTKPNIATLQINDQDIELPTMQGTLGPDVIDTRTLGKIGRASCRERVSLNV